MKCHSVSLTTTQKSNKCLVRINTVKDGSSNCGDHLVWVIFLGVMVIDYDVDIDDTEYTGAGQKTKTSVPSSTTYMLITEL